MTKPLFVAISDIHFNINTLEIASKSLKAARNKAEELNIPLIIAGDLNDTKAIIRAEVANAIIKILKPARIKVYILEGNHDKVNEKGREHGLNYLEPYAEIIDRPRNIPLNRPSIGDWDGWVTFLPYSSSPPDSLPTEYVLSKLVVMHQGFMGAFMGDYIQDKSSMSVDIVKDYTVISGHYHRHQTLGTVTYIGSPYTITFGEANDGPKGFLVVNTNGTFTREILKLRKHIIVERTLSDLETEVSSYNPGDLVRIKVKGTRQELNQVDKHALGLKLFGHSNYRLDLIVEESTKEINKNIDLTDNEIMLELIEQNAPHLKQLYLEVLNETQESKTR